MKKAIRVTGVVLEIEVPEPAIFSYMVFINEGEMQMGSITVPDNSPGVNATVQLLDAEGHPTTADDVPQWSSSDETVGVVTPSEDGMSASVAIGAPGATVIEFRSTNTDGTEVVCQGTITAQPGDAVIGEITFEEA